MKEIHTSKIIDTISQLCQKSNISLPPDVVHALQQAEKVEPWPAAKHTLQQLIENLNIANEKQIPICQDTGIACVFIEIGQDVQITGSLSLSEAIHEGVRQGYQNGYLRKSVVCDPLHRKNTNDNTPALIYYDILLGDELKITVAPKGFGSENMSRSAMLKPSDGKDGVRNFIIDTIRQAGPNPCPPIIVGVGIGGSFDKVALLAKRALLRSIDSKHADPFYAQFEEELLCEINNLGIGPQGFGGLHTALGLNIETFPTHIAGLPVAVNICCHVSRHACATL